MCDYSLEHLNTTQAKEGERYIFDNRITHGFLTKESKDRAVALGDYSKLLVACCTPGQRLQISGLMADERGAIAPVDDVVTMVQRRQDPKRYLDFGPCQDGILFSDGSARPLICLVKCEMTVLPAQPERDLDKLLAIEPGRVPAARSLVRRLRDLVDA